MSVTNRRKSDAEHPDEARKVRLQPKSLYQIPDGGMITGIANGVSTYFDINVRIIRGIFIFLTLVTKGAFAILYFILIFIIPVAKTKADLARANGLIYTDGKMVTNN
jgi:phage shock protein PspC (stress-responsive transcriptional regulator)